MKTFALYTFQGGQWWFRMDGSEQAVRAKIKAIRAYILASGKTPYAFWIKEVT